MYFPQSDQLNSILYFLIFGQFQVVQQIRVKMWHKSWIPLENAQNVFFWWYGKKSHVCMYRCGLAVISYYIYSVIIHDCPIL